MELVDLEHLKNIESIEAYVEGRLDKDELQRFETFLQTDSQLRDELELYNTLVAGIRSQNQKDEIRKNLISIDSELDRNKKRFANPLTIAAIIILALCGSWILYSNLNEKAQIKKYMVDDAGLPVLMGAHENRQLDEAMSLYKLGKYDASYKIIQNLLHQNVVNDTLQYYSGVLLLKMEKPAEAIKYFERVLLYSNSIFKEESQYRLGMSLWMLGEKEKANDIFEVIAKTDNHPYGDRTKEILKKL